MKSVRNLVNEHSSNLTFRTQAQCVLYSPEETLLAIFLVTIFKVVETPYLLSMNFSVKQEVEISL